MNPKPKTALPKTLKVNDYEEESCTQMAELFNTHFTHITEKLNFSNVSPNFKKINMFISSKLTETDFFEITPVDDYSLLCVINKLNINKSGIDNIGPNILKLAAPYISMSLIYILNLSIKTGIFPDSLKSAKVTPIFKAGDKSDPNNYTPISVLPTLSKIFEKLICLQLNNFIDDHKV